MVGGIVALPTMGILYGLMRHVGRIAWLQRRGEALRNRPPVDEARYRIVAVEAASTLPHRDVVIEVRGREALIQTFLLAADLLHRFLLLRLEQIGVELLVLLVALVSERTGSTLAHLDGSIAFWLLQAALNLFRAGQFATFVPGLAAYRLVHSRLGLGEATVLHPSLVEVLLRYTLRGRGLGATQRLVDVHVLEILAIALLDRLRGVDPALLDGLEFQRVVDRLHLCVVDVFLKLDFMLQICILLSF